MTHVEFITWLRNYLKMCEQEQISLIKEKLLLVNASDIGYNYMSMLDKDKTSIAAEKLDWSVSNTNGTYSTQLVDTFTDSDPHK